MIAKSTKDWVIILFASVLILDLFSCHDALAIPAMYQRCESSTDCIIGEYVFDNSYNILTGNICKINIRYPNGTLYVTAANLTNTSYGWHQYTVNVGSPLGFYSSLMCCNNSGDYSCMDKSFILGVSFETLNESSDYIKDKLDNTVTPYLQEINSTTHTTGNISEIAGAVWNESGRSLSNPNWTTLVDINNLNASLRTFTGNKIDEVNASIKAKIDDLNTSIRANEVSLINKLNTSLISTIANTNTTIQTKLDKILGNFSDIPTLVWNSATRTITNLWSPSYVWNETTRTLTALGFNVGIDQQNITAIIVGTGQEINASHGTGYYNETANLTGLATLTKIDELNDSLRAYKLLLTNNLNDSLRENILLEINNLNQGIQNLINANVSQLTTQIAGRGSSNLTLVDLNNLNVSIKTKIDELNSSVITLVTGANNSVHVKLDLTETEATALSRYINLTAQILGKGGSNLTTTDLDAYCDLINYADVWNETKAITNESIYNYFTEGTNANQFKADISNLVTSLQLGQNTTALLSAIAGKGSSNLTATDLDTYCASQSEISSDHGTGLYNATTADISTLATSSQLNSNATTILNILNGKGSSNLTLSDLDSYCASQAEITSDHGTGLYNQTVDVSSLATASQVNSNATTILTALNGKGSSNLTITDLDTYCDTKSDIWTFASKNATCTSVLDKLGYSLTTQDWTTDSDLIPLAKTTDVTDLNSSLNAQHGPGSWESANTSFLATQSNITGLQSHGDSYWNTSTSAINASEVAKLVWDEPTVNHTITGSFGKLMIDLRTRLEQTYNNTLGRWIGPVSRI